MNRPQSQQPEAVTADAAYAAANAEMGAYRNYEITFSTWFTAILLAILGAVVTIRWGTNQTRLGLLLDARLEARLLVGVVAAAVGCCACFCQWYVTRRYDELRHYLETGFRLCVKPLVRAQPRFRPRHAIVVMHVVLTVTAVAIALWPA